MILCIHVYSLSDTCPLEYNATRGLIQNPGYPGYRNNMRCQIIIHLQKPGQAIFLKVGHFDLENNNDYLQINYERWSGSRNSRYNYAYTGAIFFINVSILMC